MLRKRWQRRLICSLILFILVVAIFGFSIENLWFREDDLGSILNGIIRNWRDAIRVFTADARSLITPMNYQRTTPNVISGFLRPMQNAFFSCIYCMWGINPWAYYLSHVIIHATNAVLFFIFCNLWMPMSLSFVAGLLLAFYPMMSWLTWIGTVQNSLATFFFLLSLLFFYLAVGNRRTGSIVYGWYIASGCAFLFSLLSRETILLLPFWAFVGAFLFFSVHYESMTLRMRQALKYTWIFFVADGVYTLMRLCAFGFQTLPRTFNNLVLRYPWLASYVHSSAIAPSGACQLQTSSTASAPGTTAAGFVERAVHCLTCLFKAWFGVLFNVELTTFYAVIAGLCCCFMLGLFLLHAYTRQITFLLWLSLGFVCVIWPGFLAYPSPRYLNLMYPFVIFIVMYGIYAAHKYVSSAPLRVVSVGVFCGAMILLIRGVCTNSHDVHGAGQACFVKKQLFEDFFTRYTFSPNTRFVVVSTPFVSDIQSIFQSFTGNLKTEVIADPFATLAERGCMGCRKDYRIRHVASIVTPISGGFRLTSLDKDHCGWWLRHSDHPIAWVPSQRSYEWTNEQYQPGRWYECSIGKFFIHEHVDNDCVSDMSFVFDDRWTGSDTVFVAWDTNRGRYEVIK